MHSTGRQQMIPRIITFGCKDYDVVKTKWTATCQTFGSEITNYCICGTRITRQGTPAHFHGV